MADKAARVNSNPAHSHGLLRLLAYPAAVVLLACLISPPLYWAGTWLAGVGILPIVEGFPFHRYFSRSVQISALLLLWPAFRWIGIQRLTELGIEKNLAWKRDLAAGHGIQPEVGLRRAGAACAHRATRGHGLPGDRFGWIASSLMGIPRQSRVVVAQGAAVPTSTGFVSAAFGPRSGKWHATK